MNAETKIKPTAAHLKAALRLHYAAPEYATLEEVRNATGRLKKRHGKQPRYCDLLAMGLWPSMGLELIGFEVKVSRQDWLNEIKDEKKSVAISQMCDRWYLVVPTEKIVKEGELPSGWGMIVVTGTAVREVVPAPKLESKPLTREFLASLLRNATTSNPDYVEIQTQIAAGIAANQPLKRRRNRDTVSALEVRRLKKVIAEFEVEHNVKIDTKSRERAEPVVPAGKAIKTTRAIRTPRISRALGLQMMAG